MKFFDTMASETDLFPLQNVDVIRCEAALKTALVAAEPARQAWRDYLHRHRDDVIGVPWPKEKAALSEADLAAQQAVAAAEAARALALTAAIERAKEAWNARILDQMRDDDATITAFIELLDRHEQLVEEASRAGVREVLKVSETFLTSTEVRNRYEYAKRALGLI